MSRAFQYFSVQVLFLAAIICVSGPSSAESTVAQGQQPTLAADEGALSEVIVTAQKREQRLQDVPISDAVLGSAALEMANISSGTEIARQIPNLRVSQLGDESQPKFSLRGLSISSYNLNTIAPTGVFYDEVYVGAQFLGGAQIYDLERVEVLRGPQGTLFGKNTTAGAINFISKAPTFENQAYATLGYGSHNFMEIKGAVEAPVIDDRLSVRFAFDAAHSDGYIKNVTPGGSDLSNIDRKSGRLTIGYKDDNGFRATLRVFRMEEDPHSIGAIVTGTGPGGVDLLGRNPRINPYTGAPLGPDQIARSADFPNGIKVRGTGEYLTIEKDLGFATLTSITSHIQGSFLNHVDADGSVDPLLHITFGAHDKETGQDLRLATGGSGPFTMIGGLYFNQNEMDIDTLYDIAYVGVPLDQLYSQKRTSYAGYVDGTYDVGSLFTAYGGVRYTDDKGHMTEFRVTPIIPSQPQLTYHDGEPTGRLGVRKQFNPDLMIYAQFAHGYRSSDFNGGAVATLPNVARPEKLNAYELGLKSQWFDRRLTFNTSAFLYNFKDQQFVSIVSIGNQQLVNAGRSRIKGLEMELVAKATDRLVFNAGVGLLHSEYLELVVNGENLAGNQLMEAPRYTANIAADYTVPVWAAGTLQFHVDGTRVGAQYFNAQNTSDFRIDPFSDVGARIGYRPSGEDFEVAVYGKNLTNNRVPTGVADDAPSQILFRPIPYPRRFGVELTGRF